jgi:hypothetical protein
MGDVIHLGPASHDATSETDVLPHSRRHLIGAFLRWKRYRRWTTSQAVGSCELCDAPFTEGGEPGLNAGYSVVGGGPAGQDDFCWVCAICFEMWRDHFDWTVLDTSDRPSQPAGLLQSFFTRGVVPAGRDQDDPPARLRLLTPLT